MILEKLGIVAFQKSQGVSKLNESCNVIIIDLWTSTITIPA